MHEYYCAPKAYPPFGLSDHNTVVASPKVKERSQNTKKIITKRDMRPSRKAELWRYLNSINWSMFVSTMYNSEEMWNNFHKIVYTGLDLLMPVKQIKLSANHVRWMNLRLKSLIQKRQKAFVSNDTDSTNFKFYRNLVNRERKSCRAKFYKSNIQNMKDENPSRWWKEVKRLSNMKTKTFDIINKINVSEFSNLSHYEKANMINAAFLEPLEEYRLHVPPPRLPLEQSTEFLNVSEERVRKVLLKLNARKASGPDKLPN